MTTAMECAAGELLAEMEHGPDYYRARQQYLHLLGRPDPQNDPAFATLTPQQQAALLQQVQNLPAHARGFLRNQWRQKGQQGQYMKGVPGMDVGHALGKHGQHSPANFRLETATDNRRRWVAASKVWPGVKKRDLPYRELEAELVEAARLMAEQRC
jgi:hypothetical protein